MHCWQLVVLCAVDRSIPRQRGVPTLNTSRGWFFWPSSIRDRDISHISTAWGKLSANLDYAVQPV
ncbi:hypothetical protein PILCRDRAFT_821210 [Piloderma croceum F 1598]|uniref:Uncharacterized protein n=1 Tax=Piloderma croceum (strain F 1598) TaxID=765440 RepID=A0A0C3BWV6_PILCF|nr:hypothetical protein PILCRDRAFT_821210 [Piloderma croceum F 1598]